MENTTTETERRLAHHPVLRVVKALTIIALGVIALAFTLYVVRFARNVSRQAGPDAQPAVTSPQSGNGATPQSGNAAPQPADDAMPQSGNAATPPSGNAATRQPGSDAMPPRSHIPTRQ